MRLTIADIEAKFATTSFPRIQGEPDFHQLRALQLQIEDYASSIQCNEVGGLHGYLWLTKSATEWAAIDPNNANTMPTHPGPLNVVGTKTVDNFNEQAAHKTEMDHYENSHHIRAVLITKITEAMDHRLTVPLRDVTTRRITKSIPEIFDYLYQVHGQVEHGDVLAKENELRTTPYDLSDPIQILFNNIEDFKVFSKAAGEEKTDQQIINLTLTILRDCGEFETTLESWHALQDAQKTWTNLKTIFQEKYLVLRKVRGKSMKNSLFQQQANMIKDSYERDLRDIQATIDDIANTFKDDYDKENAPPPTEQKANLSMAKNADSSKLDLILKKLQTIEGEVETLKKAKPTTEPKPKLVSDGGQKRRYIDKYCWSCGASNHSSAKCKKKKDNHKDEATFTNKMGGSTLFCKFVEN